MFGSTILEVAIGLVFVYLLLSMLCSTINEQVIARFLALRATILKEGIDNMLPGPQGSKGSDLVDQLYKHPLIKGLSQNAASNNPRKPSYIPGDTFAHALMDVVHGHGVDNTPAPPIPDSLALLLKKANDDPAEELASIETWYNTTMDRVSGWYKRRVQLIIFALGFVIVVGLNIDTFSLITNLTNNSVMRAAIVSAAQGSAGTQSSAGFAALQQTVVQIQPAIGWSTSTLPADFWGWVLKIVGLLATIFAVSLGAPFWFDVLNKFMTFRSSGAPPQKSAGSADSTGAPLQLVVTGASASPNIHPQTVESTYGSKVAAATDSGNASTKGAESPAPIEGAG
jgi:hypothetical protein